MHRHPAVVDASAMDLPLLKDETAPRCAGRAGRHGATAGAWSAKIRDAGLRFELPAAEDTPERWVHVLASVHAACGTSRDAVPGADTGLHHLVEEALFLIRRLVALTRRDERM
jgi:hypothetical protein